MATEDKKRIQAALASSKLFSGIDPEVLEQVAAIAHEVVVPADTVLCSAFVPNDTCYVVASGAANLSRNSIAGGYREYFRLGPGESFGEVFLLTSAPTDIDLKTLEETRMVLIPRRAFLPILGSSPELADALGSRIATWFARAGAAVERQAAANIASGRLRFSDVLLVLVLSIVVALAFNFSNPDGIPLFPKSIELENVSFINAAEAFDAHENGNAVFVDAMPAAFHEREHIPGAVNIPLAIFDFMYELSLGSMDKDRDIIVYGRTISKRYDQEVAEKLLARGHRSVKLLAAGLEEWKKRGYPVAP